MSDLDGVTVTFPEQPCTFSLAQAAAGISLHYDVVVAHDVGGVINAPENPCEAPGPSGLISLEQLYGNGQKYCLCDLGLCAQPPMTPVTLKQGSFPATFSWDGRNWSGPSDTGNPEGPPFPPGMYVFEVTAKGTRLAPAGDTPFTVDATFPVVLVP